MKETPDPTFLVFRDHRETERQRDLVGKDNHSNPPYLSVSLFNSRRFHGLERLIELHEDGGNVVLAAALVGKVYESLDSVHPAQCD